MRSESVVRIAGGVIALLIAATVGAGRGRQSAPLSRDSGLIAVQKFVIPMYSPAARQALIQGDVVAVVDVSSDGTVKRITRLSGPPLLAGHVRDALLQWTFMMRGARTTELSIRFQFTLKGAHSQDLKAVSVSGRLPELVQITANPPQTDRP